MYIWYREGKKLGSHINEIESRYICIQSLLDQSIDEGGKGENSLIDLSLMKENLDSEMIWMIMFFLRSAED